MPKDSINSFFEHKNVTDYKTSFLATYSSTTNSYTFNNIANLITAMKAAKKSGRATENWNKAVLVPVTIEYTEATNHQSARIIGINNCLALTSAKLVKGTETDSPIKISVIYNKVKR